MGLFYNYFTGTGSAADVAYAVASLVIRKLNVAADAAALANSIAWKLRAVYNSFGGHFRWADLGGAILDLGEFIVNLLPAGRVVDVVQILWGASNML